LRERPAQPKRRRHQLNFEVPGRQGGHARIWCVAVCQFFLRSVVPPVSWEFRVEGDQSRSASPALGGTGRIRIFAIITAERSATPTGSVSLWGFRSYSAAAAIIHLLLFAAMRVRCATDSYRAVGFDYKSP
jgi:hypothetical protein